MHDALCVVKRVLESKMVVPGGGAVEAAISIYLENFATSLVRANIFLVVKRKKKERKFGCKQLFVTNFSTLLPIVLVQRNLLQLRTHCEPQLVESGIQCRTASCNRQDEI